MKYIFVAGAPGSKWSSVVKNIYYSPSIDRSDSSDVRTYNNQFHLGAYWDPGMEFGQNFDKLNEFNKTELETEFDRPFSGTGIRIIKSHVFSNHIDYIKNTWPECPIVLVHRPDDACLGWWVKSGQFDITYPSYKGYYKDFNTMAEKIKEQNTGIQQAWIDFKGLEVYTNLRLALHLGLSSPPADYNQNYQDDDISVKVI